MHYGEFFPWGFVPAMKEDDGGGSGDTETSTKSGDGDAGSESKKDKGTGTEGTEESKTEKSEEDTLRNENNRLKREAAERSRKDREAEQKRQKEEGKFKELAEAETKRADDAEALVAKLERDRVVSIAAKTAGMEFPEDASRYLTEDEMTDAASAEGGMRRLKQERPKLFTELRESGGEINNGTEGGESTPPTSRTNTSGNQGPMGLERLRGVKRKT